MYKADISALILLGFFPSGKTHAYYFKLSFKKYITWSVLYKNVYIFDLVGRIFKMHLSTGIISGLEKNILQPCSLFLLPSHLFDCTIFYSFKFGSSVVCGIFLVVLIIPFSSSSGRIFLMPPDKISGEVDLGS